MTIQDTAEIRKVFNAHSKVFQEVIDRPIIQEAAAHIRLNDHFLTNGYSVAFFEGYFSGKAEKLTLPEWEMAHYFLQRLLDLKIAQSKK